MIESVCRSISTIFLIVKSAYHALTTLFWQTIFPQDPSNSPGLRGRVSKELPVVVLETRRELHAYLGKYADSMECSLRTPLIRGSLTRCWRLHSVQACRVKKVCLESCWHLEELASNSLIEIKATDCPKFKSVNVLHASTIHLEDCLVKKLIAPLATYVNVEGCFPLEILRAPLADYLNARQCCSLTDLIATNAKEVCIDGCRNLQSATLPNAVQLYAANCLKLTAIDAPKASYLNIEGCLNLSDLKAPQGEVVKAGDCPQLLILGRQQLPLVKILALGGRKITSLPKGIGELTTLEELKILSPYLKVSPDEIFRLPSTCTVDLSVCIHMPRGFRERVIEEDKDHGPIVLRKV